jgi:hypothetical protein
VPALDAGIGGCLRTQRRSRTITTSSTQRDDWLGPWPLNLVGRQWRRVTGLTGWRRAIALVGIAVEVVVIIAIIVLLIV